ncbi:MAG: hypothetical protein EAZ84_00430 [Verrucomicrobia bacterium]|nr:MAG: hypothetical protein EAZ84_00430 [Verrucomicrobiota bacterium]
MQPPSTMKKSLAILAFAALLPVLPATAQNANQDPAAENQTEESNGPHRFWQASLPGGHYMVAIDRIASISMHQYVLDAQLLVDEVVIDTNGRNIGIPVKLLASGGSGGLTKNGLGTLTGAALGIAGVGVDVRAE